MIDVISNYPTPADALAAFSAEGLTFTDKDDVEHIKTADIDGLAISEVGERFTMTSPGTPGDPLDPPVYTGDGLHWVVYRHLAQDDIPNFLLTTAVWHSKMVDAGGLAVPRPTDGSIPPQFWL